MCDTDGRANDDLDSFVNKKKVQSSHDHTCISLAARVGYSRTSTQLERHCLQRTICMRVVLRQQQGRLYADKEKWGPQ